MRILAKKWARMGSVPKLLIFAGLSVNMVILAMKGVLVYWKRTAGFEFFSGHHRLVELGDLHIAEELRVMLWLSHE